ncbi:MAG: S8 family peptidase [Lentimicrobiaceae bacterium]|nr:S8 family peptidase [Lentimicrobiaceae bacterium]
MKQKHFSLLFATKATCKNKIFFVVAVFGFLFSSPVSAQNPNCFRITFSDKNDSSYSIDRPEEFLSSRAIVKRERFDISITEQDLPVNQQYITIVQALINTPTYIIATSKWNNSVVLHCPEVSNWEALVEELQKFSFVTDVLPVATYQIPKSVETPIHKQTSNAVIYASSCDYNYGPPLEQIRVHEGHALHKAGFCGEDMLICVFDAGWNNFNTLSQFKYLYDNGQIWGTRDLAPQMNDVYIGHDHGTMVTSIMASAMDGYFVGTAPQANYFFIRSEYPWDEQLVEEDFWTQAAEIADSLGADVINSSLGYTDFDYEWQNIYTPDDNNGTASIISRAASILAQKGVIVVNSAGNSGNNDWRFIGRPADAFDILAVGAMNKDGAIAGFSSYGPSADGRTKPDVTSVGWNTWIINSYGDRLQGNGTSFSSPVIAGLSACLWQALPQYSSLELMQLIREYSHLYHNPNDRMGYGIPNYYKIYAEHGNDIPEQKISSFTVYPNPTTGELFIEHGRGGACPFSTITNIEIFDVYGKKTSFHLLLTSSSPHLINISHLNPGIYFLRVTSNNSVEMIKIVKR